MSTIEVMVKVGDTIKVDQSLIAVESDKASMEIPASHAGIVKQVHIKVGDMVAEASLLLVLETAGAESVAAEPAAVCVPATATTAAPHAYAGKVDIACDLLVLGGGPGGYSAAFRVAALSAPMPAT